MGEYVCWGCEDPQEDNPRDKREDEIDYFDLTEEAWKEQKKKERNRCGLCQKECDGNFCDSCLDLDLRKDKNREN